MSPSWRLTESRTQRSDVPGKAILALLLILILAFGLQAQPQTTVRAARQATESAAKTRRWRISENGRYIVKDGKVRQLRSVTEAFNFFFQKMNSLEIQESYFKHLRDNGINTLIVQIDTQADNAERKFFGDNHFELEPRLGEYNPEVIQQFRDMLDLAQKLDLGVITYVQDTFHQDFSWEFSPYNKANGGPAEFESDMLRPPTWPAQEKKLKMLVDEFGNHPALMGIELANEIDWAMAGGIPANRMVQVPKEITDKSPRALWPEGGTWMPDPRHVVAQGDLAWFQLGTQQEMKDFVDHFAAFVKSYQRERWGNDGPLLMVSTNNPNFVAEVPGKPETRDWLYTQKDLDLIAHHQYDWRDRVTTYPKDVKKFAEAIRDMNHGALRKCGFKKPVIDTESGPLGWFIKERIEKNERFMPLDDEMYHVQVWSTWASGAASTGSRWPYPNHGFGDHPFLNPLSPSMVQDNKAIARVSEHVDWEVFDNRPADRRLVVADTSLFATGLSDNDQMIGFLAKNFTQDKRPRVQTRLDVSGLDRGPYEVLWFHTRTGDVVRRDEVRAEPLTSGASGLGFPLQTPEFDTSLAFVVRPKQIKP